MLTSAEPIAAPPRVSERIAARFGVTLVANVLRSVLGLLTGMILARQLGAAAYGDLWFLIATLTALLQLLDAGASSALFTMLSAGRPARAVLTTYGAWLAVQVLVPLAALTLVLPSDLLHAVWVGHPRGRVVLAFAAAVFMNQIWTVVTTLGEALRKTALVQLAAVAQSLLHFALVMIALRGSWLSVDTVILLLAVEYALLALILAPVLIRRHLAAGVPAARAGGTVAAFARYCAPLGFYGAVGAVYDFADRWLLQRFAGSMQQGFFSVGDKFATVSVLASRSIMNVFWKEIAEASERRDAARLQRLYRSVSRAMYWVGVWIAALVIPYSRQVLTWTLGPAYAPAWPILSLMLLVPAQQSLMMIGGVFLQATGRTRLFLTARGLMMLAALPATYLLLASRDQAIPGMGLGAAGLAMKILLVQAIGVLLQVALISRAYQWTMDWGHQLLVPAALGGWALCAYALAGWLAGLWGGGEAAHAAGGAAIYALGSVALAVRLPWLLGFRRDTLLGEARVLLTAMRTRLRPAHAG